MNSKESPERDANNERIESSRQTNSNEQQRASDNEAREITPKFSASSIFEVKAVSREIELGNVPEVCTIEVLSTGQYRYTNSEINSQTWLNIVTDKIIGKSPDEIFNPENAREIIKIYDACVRSQQVVIYREYLQQTIKTNYRTIALKPQLDEGGKVSHLTAIAIINQPEGKTTAELNRQASREQLLGAIALRISQSLDLETILQQAVNEVRSFLQCDRVLIYRFNPGWQGEMAVESVIEPWISVLDRGLRDSCFTDDLARDYCNGRIQVIENIHNVDLAPCYRDLLIACQAQANLVIPITAEAKLWGLLIVQHCRQPHQWRQTTIELLKQLATKVGIAVQQAELLQQVQKLNISLEAEVEQRTAQLQQTLQQLQQALKSEELVRSITQVIRDSLDEKQILHAATKSLVRGLDIKCCQIELYKFHHQTTEVIYEYPLVSPDEPKIQRQISDCPELYQQLLAKTSVQFVDWLPTVGHRQQQATRLICPIFDDRGILGNLWLMRPKEEVFEFWETQLVQQIADQCAIAIRQARLYAAEQIQVQELEKLNLVKDDFLKTISHELRTPMSRIRLAISTLENLLEVEIGGHPSDKIEKVMEIFHSAYKKQNQLVDDLLTLCYVDAASKPDIWQSIELETWIPQIVKTFALESKQKQPLRLDLAKKSPPLHTDAKMLKRVLNELLNNAYKYTPAGGQITLATSQTKNRLLIEVINTGVEIPTEEQERIFDKFYRIPNNDPWQYGGTGIGLALVKKLVELLEGEISVSSHGQITTFTVAFAIN